MVNGRASIWFLGWVLVAMALGGGSRAIWRQWEATWPQGRPLPVESWRGASPAVIFGSVGGLRQVVANAFWIQTYLAWERQDAEATLRQAARAVQVEPENWFFWQNTARIVAYDFVRWPSAAAFTVGMTPAEAEVYWLRVAFGWLGRAEAALPPGPEVDLERASLHLHRRGDRRAAALAYQAAWQQPNAPYFAGRLGGELLRQSGDLEGALEWYERLYAELPDGVPEAEKERVAARLSAWAEALGRTKGG